MVFDMDTQAPRIWIATAPGSRADELMVRLKRLGFAGACHFGSPEKMTGIRASDHLDIEVADLTPDGALSGFDRAGRLWEERAIPTLFLIRLQDMAGLIPQADPHAYRIVADSCSDDELKLNLMLSFHARRKSLDRKKRQKALEKEAAWLKLLVEESRDGIVVVDLQGRACDANHVFAQTLGYTMEEILGMSVWDWDAPRSKTYILDKLKNVSVSGDLFETVICRKDGSLLNAEVSIKAASWEGRKVVCCICRDITDRIRSRDKLQESQARLAALSDASFESIFLSDQGLCLDQNLTARKMFGYTRDEAVGRYGMEWILPADRDKVRNNILSGYEKAYEVTALRKDGTTFPAEIQGRMFTAFGRRIRITALRDISERKKIEAERLDALAQVAEAGKMALVGQVAGKMAHDFNNVLGIIMSNAELSLLDCEDPNTRPTLELILEQTFRGKNLTRNLVAFAKDQEPRQAFFPVDEKIDLVLTLMRKDLDGIHLVRDYDKTGPDLFADPGMVEHALVNVLQNAIHALSRSSHPTILIRTYYKDEYVWIQIEDNGCGIPKASLGRIFEPSFTLKGSRDKINAYRDDIKGTGYGMANLKKYVSRHQGRVEVSSTVRQGTRVEIGLPVIERHLTRDEIRQVEIQGLCTGCRILLVEDEPAIADVQHYILTQPPCCHKVDVADAGQDAITLFDRKTYDMVSLDYMLPGGISGMDVYHHIRKKNPNIPILFISGNIEFLESISDLTLKDPCIAHLSKPCRNMDYLKCIHRLVKKVKAA